MSDRSESKPRIIYLIGAGASYPALPLASGVSAGMIKWGAKLRGESLHVYKDSAERDWILEMAEELTRWGNEASRVSSIDDIANKLIRAKKNKDLIKLKTAMSVFFMMEQSLSDVEQRYDRFFASILKKSGFQNEPPVLPSSIGILTWNYDRQLEKAYYKHYANVCDVYNHITDNPEQIVRLNGLLGRAVNKGTGADYALNFSKDKLGVYKYVIREYKSLLDNEPDVSFSPERNKDYKTDRIKSLVSGAKTLIIVGYSFPIDNQFYDRQFLLAMNKIEKIYLQVLPQDFCNIKARIKTFGVFSEIELIEDRSQFYIPHNF